MRPHQNQAIAQKLGILGEKVTSMTGLRIKSTYWDLFRTSFLQFYMTNFNNLWSGRLWSDAPISTRVFANFSKLGGI